MNCNGNSPLESPLRYPGGKVFLCPYMEQFLRLNQIRPHVFVEPFAGGASLSLHLLGKDLVDRAALFDLDPLVSDFWWTVFNQNAWLRNLVQSEAVTLGKWLELRGAPLAGRRQNAWKCLFLNRTSFSGILCRRAGPLGGRKQASRYKIDCRFYRATILKRLAALQGFQSRIETVETARWQTVLARYQESGSTTRQSCLLYLDPPFFHKAERLYNLYFTAADHEEVVRALRELKVPWFLSYDCCPEAVGLFRKYGLHYRTVPVLYTSAQQVAPNHKKELVASNLVLPEPNR